jgi:hypothetical protein
MGSVMKRIVLLAVLSTACAASFSFAEELDFLHWRLLEHKRVDDGGILEVFSLEGGGSAEKIEIFYTSVPLKILGGSSLKMERTPEIGIFYRQLDPAEKTVELYSYHYEAIELWARAERDGRIMIAQTRLSLFGNAAPREGGFIGIETLPDLPNVSVSRSFNFANPDAETIEQSGVDRENAYAYSIMQSGEQAAFRVIRNGAPDDTIESMRIYEAGVLGATLPLEEDHFVFNFPNYPDLAQASFFAWKDVVLLFESEGEVISCYIPVYRALYGDMNLNAGLVCLLVVLVLCAGVVCFMGRRGVPLPDGSFFRKGGIAS